MKQFLHTYLHIVLPLEWVKTTMSRRYVAISLHWIQAGNPLHDTNESVEYINQLLPLFIQ